MAMTDFEPVIGLEVHAELHTQSKMFCGCAVVDPTQAEPNSAVCEVCTGMPGTLPVINRAAVEFALRVALALDCRVCETSVFARKNYFYPDLPKGYQISQYELPLAVEGKLAFEVDGDMRSARIRRVHLEEDTGKLVHGAGYSLIDYNRSGVPLLEIVSEPDLRSVAEVKGYATALRSLLRYLDVTSGDMEKGAIRFEANISVRRRGSDELGVRTEIKNLNSFRAMLRALEYEIDRQAGVLQAGGKVAQETLGWDEARGVTVSQRGKEEAHDYRYFPEPDLPPLVIEPDELARIRATQPELPLARRDRFLREFGLTPYTAGVLTSEKEVADYFEAAVAAAPEVSPARVANWLTVDLFGLLNEAGSDITSSKVPPAALAELAGLVETGQINQGTAKAVLAEVVDQGGSPAEIVAARGLSQLTEASAIESLVDRVLQENPEQVQLYLGGKTTVSQWFFGQVMKAAGGKAHPPTVQEILAARLAALEAGRTAR
jgi:aspartyl-tRNA(Asn)/glutamyl-tRNA(Gln) amidotransferase subunit B